MADPKYANLPGIDTQPDVYETVDLPEEDQREEIEWQSDSVEQLNVDPGVAFSQFKAKKLIAGKIDFSDRVSGSRRTGYYVPRTEYEILEDGSDIKETPVQKFQRLQHEIRELSDEVEQLKQTAESSKSTATVTSVSMLQQVGALQEQLYNLHLEKILGTDAVVEAADPQGTLPKKLISQLEAYKTVQSSTKTPSKIVEQSQQNDCITYELHYNPEQTKFTQLSKVSELEGRLTRLEAAIGQDPEKLSFLTSDTSSKCLMEAVSQLSQQTQVMDHGQIDRADARIQALLQHLNQVKEKKKTADDAAKESQISELYDMVSKWDSVADTVPVVVERLQALKDLHEQALQFSQALSHLDTAQQQLTSNLNNQDTLLKELSQSFASNMAAMQENCKSLEERMKKLKK